MTPAEARRWMRERYRLYAGEAAPMADPRERPPPGPRHLTEKSATAAMIRRKFAKEPKDEQP
ncbi:MAG: hypothetical protein SFU83_23585 [Meiothermus sp.]|nr:hypothetical protein [Meiothermus sp.]